MSKRDIDIKTSDGTAKAGLFLPDVATPAVVRPGVILYMDAFGPRAALDGMAQRLCDEGYIVLVPDLFYRFGAYGPFDAPTAFKQEVSAKQLRAMIDGTSQAMTAADTAHFLDALADAGVDGPAGVVGYCMGGSRALTAAAAYPDRIAAAASFHGGNLASDKPDSPHLQAASVKARVYVGAAGVDGSFPPHQAAHFVEAYRVAEVDFVLENYVGMAHGWCVPDHSVYDEVGAERHWRRLATFFGETLK
ncbi:MULTISPECIES: dienelactone hydrolase family protein [Alphaproteobacteria]|uniref:Dienelactone hydrolase n=2 Tax=Alphaproteobacteria TaxID=28211 RepID=A0A512HMX7_9HYPH|nr:MULTISPECIES: dienelactone hydrolase family protein [Alphaproteobacteria]GEO86806.1 dienelactone hydrolase [Ciceribacter naphthalenivorans]GLR23386.1 dienelactone hydrolase [Ciceribacter naphthalenivorans]GLT06242.1 dienelactone hydrolase [Sphingomonas psychrolutea]